jgi:predicted DNA-binding transcriptional regulator AlpA
MKEHIVAVQEAAEIVSMTEAQLRHAVSDGKVIPEATVAGHSLWRAATLKRWARSSRRSFPMSPKLEVVGLAGIAERFGVSVAAIRKYRYDGSLPAPDHTPSGLLLWDESTVEEMTPWCSMISCSPKNSQPHRVKVTSTRTTRGRRVEVRCQCGAWTEMRPPGKPKKR